MLKGKILQILQEKLKHKKKIENDWQNFLRKDTCLLLEKLFKF